MATARAVFRGWRTTSMSSVSVRLTGLFGGVALLHVLGWGIMLLLVAPRFPVMLGLGGLAYAFGLRHAFDADHISAIDNTTRKLLQERKKPLGVGFFFSLGHSSVVFLIALLLGLAIKSLVRAVVSGNGELRSLGGLVGTTVSGVFLIVIGVLNLLILLDIVRVYRDMKQGRHDAATLRHELVAGRVVGSSWHMYPVGFLFGLGFDTASEVALLAISAGAAAESLPFLAVVSLPLIFAA